MSWSTARRPAPAVAVRALVWRAWPALMLMVALGCAGRGQLPRPETATPAGLTVAGWSPDACRARGADADADGLDDGCELALARAFAPELVVDRRDCLWTDAPPAPRLAGGYLFAAAPAGAGVRLAYLPAYFRDCGWRGPVCAIARGDCGAHAGDSEFILVDVAPDTGTRPGSTQGGWRTTGVFLSSHCFSRAGKHCRWYRGQELAEFTWADGRPLGAPRVWVARGKHAHYRSARACDRGHWNYDSCDGNREVVRFPVRSAAQNVGARGHPLHGAGGCLAAAALPLGPAGADLGTVECVWDPARPFRGWQRAPAGPAPTAYARSLGRTAGW